MRQGAPRKLAPRWLVVRLPKKETPPDLKQDLRGGGAGKNLVQRDLTAGVGSKI